MIHCIYLKNNPKKSWHLVNVAVSAESTSKIMEDALSKAIENGYLQAEVGIQVQEISDHIPEILKNIKNSKLMYN
jgi:hypothetical protein